MGLRTGLVVLVLAAGCRQLLGLNDLPTDAPLPDVYIPDAGPCQQLGLTCVGPVLRSCTTLGEEPTDMTCMWGCSDTGTSHCAQLAPAGGGVMPSDLDPDADLIDTTLATNLTIDGDSGAIAGVRNGGDGIVSGIGFKIENNVAVFTFANLTISSPTLLLRGGHPIALVATNDLVVTGTIDAVGDCLSTDAGPGGFAGGPSHSTSLGNGGGGGGTGITNNASGGGGGGYGAHGGDGGMSQTAPTTAGGLVWGTPEITMLLGGGGGGGGGGLSGPVGAGGGGAVQLVANRSITIAGKINAGGCGGAHGGASSGGAGGGAGGTILIESYAVLLGGTAILAANGGGGGAGGGGTDGDSGQLTNQRATGGSSGVEQGGDGGSTQLLTGDPGANDNNTGFGGGGGVGRIRINSATGVATITAGAVLSPPLDQPQGTQGVVATQ